MLVSFFWWPFCAVRSSDRLRVPVCASGRGSERPADSVEEKVFVLLVRQKLQEMADETARGEMKER